MRFSVNINNDIESIVRSYSEIKQCFSSSSTILQFEYNHVLEYHLHNIEEKLLNIRSEATAVKALIDAELSPSKSVDTNNSTTVSAHESVSSSYPTARPTQPYRPTIDVAKYRTDIFSQPSEPEQPEENKTIEKN